MICNTYKAFFQTLGDSTKLELLFSLKKRPQTVTELIGSVKLEQSNVSHQLGKLRKLGFVRAVREGKAKRYALMPDIARLLALIDTHVNTYYHKYCKCKGNAKRLRWQDDGRKNTGGRSWQ